MIERPDESLSILKCLDKICKIIFNKRKKEIRYVEKGCAKSGSDSRPPPKLTQGWNFKGFNFTGHPEMLAEGSQKVNEMLKHLPATPTDTGSHNSCLS